MAKLPSFKRIIGDALGEFENLREPLVVPLNAFMESISRALNNRLTFSENMDSQVITFTADGQYPIKLSWERPSRPRAVWIGQISRVDGAPAALSSAVTLDWAFNQSGQIEIADIVGLTPSNSDQYSITIIGVTG